MHEYFFQMGIILFALFIGFILASPLRHNTKFRCLFSVFFAVIIYLFYFYMGGSSALFLFKEKQKHELQVKHMLKNITGRKHVIKLMRLKLEENPKDAKAWYLLGRLYAGDEDWMDAKNAFKNAIKLDNAKDAYKINYAQSLWQLNHHRFNDTIRSIFETVLLKNPQQPDSLAMLAMDRYQRKYYDEAINYWEQLLLQIPYGSQDAQAVRKAIAKAQQSMKL